MATKLQTKRLVGVVSLAAASLLAVSAPSTGAATKVKAKPKKTLTVQKRPAATNFRIKFLDDVKSVTAGETATYRLTVTPASSLKGNVIFDLPNLTDQFTAQLFEEEGANVRLEISVPPLASTNSGVFLLRSQYGTKTDQAVFRLNVTARPIPTTTTVVAPAPNAVVPKFTVSADVASRTARPGEQQQYGITVGRSDGYTGPVTFRVDGLPDGTTANFAPNPTTASTVLYITPTESTRSGRYPISVVAIAGPTVRVTSVELVVRRIGGDFSLGVAPIAVTAPRGNDAVAALNVLPKTGTVATPDVTFTASGLPAGATAVFEPNPSNGLGTVRIRTTAATPLGAFAVTITGTSGTVTSSATLRVTVVEGRTTPGFGLVAVPATQQVSVGSSANYDVAITPSGGFNAPISFRVNGLPALASYALVSQTATSAVIRINTAATTPSGTSKLQIIGTSGTLSATVETTLVVQ